MTKLFAVRCFDVWPFSLCQGTLSLLRWLLKLTALLLRAWQCEVAAVWAAMWMSQCFNSFQSAHRTHCSTETVLRHTLDKIYSTLRNNPGLIRFKCWFWCHYHVTLLDFGTLLPSLALFLPGLVLTFLAISTQFLLAVHDLLLLNVLLVFLRDLCSDPFSFLVTPSLLVVSSCRTLCTSNSMQMTQVFRSVFWQSRPNKASLKYLSVCAYVCLSIHKKLLWFQWNLACR